jgi:four helix bundle protein
MQDFKNLEVWQRARVLTRSVYEITSHYPSTEEFGLKTQMRRASVSICAAIAEGAGRRGDREFRRFLDIGTGSCCELECELIVSCDLALIPETTMNGTVASLVEIKRKLGGLMRKLIVRPRLAKLRAES